MGDLDLLDPDEAKRAINVDLDVSAYDDALALLVSGVSEDFDNVCGPVVAREVVEYFDGCGRLLLSSTPVLSITSVVESGSTVIEADYRLDGQNHDATLVRLSGGYLSTWAWGDQSVAVTYQAGRCESTADVPQRFKQAAASIVARQWRQDAPAWARSRELEGPDDGDFGDYLTVEEQIRRRLPREVLPQTVW